MRIGGSTPALACLCLVLDHRNLNAADRVGRIGVGEIGADGVAVADTLILELDPRRVAPPGRHALAKHVNLWRAGAPRDLAAVADRPKDSNEVAFVQGRDEVHAIAAVVGLVVNVFNAREVDPVV